MMPPNSKATATPPSPQQHQAKIKICGIRDPQTAEQAVAWGARYIGIMCYQPSRRYVDPHVGREIAQAVAACGGVPVAVFVDADADEMTSLCQYLSVNMAQLHGDRARQAHRYLPQDIRRIYVLHVEPNGRILQPDLDPESGWSHLRSDRDFVMYDALEGGSGCPFPLRSFVHSYSFPFFLAGGLKVDNVAEAIAAVHPDGVDVSSGVEDRPGHKSLEKIAAFIQAVKGKPV